MSVAFAFRWIDWNVEKCERHGVRPQEAEEIVDRPVRPYPRRIDDNKIMVRGQTFAGRYLQVIYLMETDDTVFVIHARPLTDNEKRNLRRKRR
jgi:uncharacterized DUF497 family protein